MRRSPRGPEWSPGSRPPRRRLPAPLATAQDARRSPGGLATPREMPPRPRGAAGPWRCGPDRSSRLLRPPCARDPSGSAGKALAGFAPPGASTDLLRRPGSPLIGPRAPARSPHPGAQDRSRSASPCRGLVSSHLFSLPICSGYRRNVSQRPGKDLLQGYSSVIIT